MKNFHLNFSESNRVSYSATRDRVSAPHRIVETWQLTRNFRNTFRDLRPINHSLSIIKPTILVLSLTDVQPTLECMPESRPAAPLFSAFTGSTRVALRTHFESETHSKYIHKLPRSIHCRQRGSVRVSSVPSAFRSYTRGPCIGCPSGSF